MNQSKSQNLRVKLHFDLRAWSHLWHKAEPKCVCCSRPTQLSYFPFSLQTVHIANATCVLILTWGVVRCIFGTLLSWGTGKHLRNWLRRTCSEQPCFIKRVRTTPFSPFAWASLKLHQGFYLIISKPYYSLGVNLLLNTEIKSSVLNPQKHRNEPWDSHWDKLHNTWTQNAWRPARELFLTDQCISSLTEPLAALLQWPSVQRTEHKQ